MDETYKNKIREEWSKRVESLEVTRVGGFFNGDTPVKFKDDIETQERIKLLLQNPSISDYWLSKLDEAYQKGREESRKQLDLIDPEHSPIFQTKDNHA